MTQLSRIMKDATVSFAGQIAAQAVYGLSLILLARYITPRDFGFFNVTLACSWILSYLADLGVTHTYVREATKDGADTRALLSEALTLRVGLSVVVSLLAFPVCWFLIEDHALFVAACGMSVLSIWGNSLQGLAGAYYLGARNFYGFAAVYFGGFFFRSVAIVSAVVFTMSASGLSLLVGGAAFAFGTVVLVTLRGRLDLRPTRPAHVAKQLASFSAGGLATILLPQAGPLVLQRVITLADVGAFSAAQKLPGYFMFVSQALSQAFYPRLFEAGHGDAGKHRDLCRYELRLLSALGLCMSLPLSVFPALVTTLAYGAKWTASASPVLAVFAWTTWLQSVTFGFADALTTAGHQTRRAAVMCTGAVVSVPLFYALGSRFGAVGGALATVVTMGGMLLVLALLTPSGVRLAASLVWPASAGCAAFVGVRWLVPASVPEWLVLPCASVVLGLVLLGTDRVVRDMVVLGVRGAYGRVLARRVSPS